MSTCTAVNVAAVPDTLSKRWKKRGEWVAIICQSVVNEPENHFLFSHLFYSRLFLNDFLTVTLF